MNLLIPFHPLRRLSALIGLGCLLLSSLVAAQEGQAVAPLDAERGTEQQQSRRQSLADYQAANERLRQEIRKPAPPRNPSRPSTN